MENAPPTTDEWEEFLDYEQDLIDERERLLDRLFDGTITPPQHERLIEVCKQLEVHFELSWVPYSE